MGRYGRILKNHFAHMFIYYTYIIYIIYYYSYIVHSRFWLVYIYRFSNWVFSFENIMIMIIIAIIVTMPRICVENVWIDRSHCRMFQK